MDNLNWFEARALATENRAPIRRTAWEYWLLYRQNVWLIDEDNILRVVRAEDFTSAEFLAKDWTDVTWTGGYRPPCTAPLPATVLPPLDGIPAFTLDPLVCGGAGPGGTPFSEPGGEELASYYPFTLIETYATGLGLTTADLGTLTVTPPPGLGSHIDGTIVTIGWTPGILSGNRYLLDAWGGDVAGADNPETLTIDAAKEIEPDFVVQHALTVTLPSDWLTTDYGTLTFDPVPDHTDGSGTRYWLTATEVEITYTPEVTVTGTPPASGSGYQYWPGSATLDGSPVTPTDGALVYAPSGGAGAGDIHAEVYTITLSAPATFALILSTNYSYIWA